MDGSCPYNKNPLIAKALPKRKRPIRPDEVDILQASAQKRRPGILVSAKNLLKRSIEKILLRAKRFRESKRAFPKKILMLLLQPLRDVKIDLHPGGHLFHRFFPVSRHTDNAFPSTLGNVAYPFPVIGCNDLDLKRTLPKQGRVVRGWLPVLNGVFIVPPFVFVTYIHFGIVVTRLVFQLRLVLDLYLAGGDQLVAHLCQTGDRRLLHHCNISRNAM